MRLHSLAPQHVERFMNTFTKLHEQVSFIEDRLAAFALALSAEREHRDAISSLIVVVSDSLPSC